MYFDLHWIQLEKCPMKNLRRKQRNLEWNPLRFQRKQVITSQRCSKIWRFPCSRLKIVFSHQIRIQKTLAKHQTFSLLQRHNKKEQLKVNLSQIRKDQTHQMDNNSNRIINKLSRTLLWKTINPNRMVEQPPLPSKEELAVDGQNEERACF